MVLPALLRHRKQKEAAPASVASAQRAGLGDDGNGDVGGDSEPTASADAIVLAAEADDAAAEDESKAIEQGPTDEEVVAAALAETPGEHTDSVEL